MPFNVDDFDINPGADGAVESQHYMTFDMPDDGSDMVDMLVQKIQTFRDQPRLDHPNTFWLKGKVTFGAAIRSTNECRRSRSRCRGVAVLPDADPPDMASVDSAPLAELRAAAAQARDGSPWLAALSPFNDEMQAMAKKAVEARLRVEARWSEVVAGVLLRDRLRNALVSDDELEWIVPRSYGWEVAGQAGQLSGIPSRVVEGVDHLYLALNLKP